MILYMKRIQAIGILAFLFTLMGCDKYNDELLTDAEVEEYGYISPIIKDDDYPLSDMNYTHTLNFYLPLVYENESFEAQFVHIKGLQYDDVLTKEWQSKRIRVTSIEKMETLPFKQLPAIDYYPFMEQDSYKIINRQEDVDSIINKLEPITDYMLFPQNISEWQNIDFEKYTLLAVRTFVDFYIFDTTDITNPSFYNSIYNNRVFPFIVDANNQVECFIFTSEIIVYASLERERRLHCLLGVLIDKDIKIDKITFKQLKGLHCDFSIPSSKVY